MEINDVLKNAGFQPIIENKQYPRERSREIAFRGRVRIQLKNDDDTPHIENFPTRDSILAHIGKCQNIFFKFLIFSYILT